MPFLRPKRTVPKPEVVTSHQSDNPMFSTTPDPALQQFRRRVLAIVGAIFGLITVAVGIYGPWLRVSAIEVFGTRALDPSSVQAVATTYLGGQSWGILPRGNLWLLSGQNLSKYLIEKISTKLSIEAVRITKVYPHRVRIQVTERTPVFVWTNGLQLATLDRQGVLIELRQQPDTNLDLVRDVLATAIQPDQQVIIPEVAEKLLTLQSSLRKNHLTVKEFIIPTPICPLPMPINANIDGNLNVEVNTNDANVNVEPPTNDHVNVAVPEAPPCDLFALRQKSQEIHVQLKDGALVLFDRHSNLDAAVTTLTRLLALPVNDKATYFDVRFEERVYIR